jgi:hypothetical protein
MTGTPPAPRIPAYRRPLTVSARQDHLRPFRPQAGVIHRQRPISLALPQISSRRLENGGRRQSRSDFRARVHGLAIRRVAPRQSLFTWGGGQVPDKYGTPVLGLPLFVPVAAAWGHVKPNRSRPGKRCVKAGALTAGKLMDAATPPKIEPSPGAGTRRSMLDRVMSTMNPTSELAPPQPLSRFGCTWGGGGLKLTAPAGPREREQVPDTCQTPHLGLPLSLPEAAAGAPCQTEPHPTTKRRLASGPRYPRYAREPTKTPNEDPLRRSYPQPGVVHRRAAVSLALPQIPCRRLETGGRRLPKSDFRARSLVVGAG